MAIQRCPYCKAIIDEGAEYCTNCGTKLLFPEDEFIEEEIPGEKIIDVDEDVSGTQQELSEPPQADTPEIEYIEEVKDETSDQDFFSEAEELKTSTEEPVDKAPAEKKPAKKPRAPRKKPPRKKAKKVEPVTIVEDEAEPVPEPEEEIQVEEPPDEHVELAAEDIIEDEIPIEPDEISAAEPSPEEGIRGITDDLPDGFADKIDEAAGRVGEPLEEFVPDQVQEEETVYTEISEKDLTPEPGTAEEKEWQTPPPIDEELKEPEDEEDSSIQTGDLEEIVDEAEKEKEEIDEFVASIKKERESVREIQIPDTQDMPPWADAVQEGPLPDIPPTDEISLQKDVSDASELDTDDSLAIEEDLETDQAEELPPASEEVALRPTPGYDTGSAFPETVDQQGLPFLGKTEEADAVEQTGYEPQAVESESRQKPQPIGFGDWIKARIFDVVFVTALWFVALWIASQVLGNSVFLLISGSALVTLIFLAVLLFIYFFFFLFFLGETLGNYLFSSEE